MDIDKFIEHINEMNMRIPNDRSEYYSFTLLGDATGKILWNCQGSWVGFDDKDNKIELRAARLVVAENILHVQRNILKEGCFVVDDQIDLYCFMIMGGNAIVEKELAKNHLPDLVKPIPVVQIGPHGFNQVSSFPKTIFQYAPTKTLRMAVLERDGFKCRICGRSPRENVDLTLHLHHIRPWAKGGLTHEDNLITLCHTCHEGLYPEHYKPIFYTFIPKSSDGIDQVDDTSRLKEFQEGVEHYRKISFNTAKADSTVKKSNSKAVEKKQKRKPSK